MGQKKARLRSFGDKAAKVAEYIKLYQHSLRALYNALPHEIQDLSKSHIATIGTSEIWPCRDGAVVLIYSEISKDINIDVKEPLSRTVDEFMQFGDATAFFAGDKKISLRAFISVGNASKSIIHFADNKITSEGNVFSTKYSRGAIFGWEADLPDPDAAALEDFQSAFLTRNVGGKEVEKISGQEEKPFTKAKAEELITEFNSLLCTAHKEEDLQIFLKNHPEFLYPDYMKCFPKFKLGEDFVTDYVLLVQGPQGPEYVFVEIEKADKEIFVKAGQFSAEFTQAKDQLLDWDNWLTKNHAYASRKLPNLYKPQFHLVIGRDSNILPEQKEKIQSEFSSTTRRFSTYDDLVNRFRTIVERLI